MAKYNEEFKLKLVMEYQEGQLGYIRLAKKHGMKDSTPIKSWVKTFEALGEKGLLRKRQKRAYSVQFKLDVLSFMKRTGSSETETALHFGLSNLGALYRRTAARKGKKRAGIAVAHAILRISYYLLTRKEMYVDLGEDYFDKQKQQSIVRYSVRRLENLGYNVTITEPEAS